MIDVAGWIFEWLIPFAFSIWLLAKFWTNFRTGQAVLGSFVAERTKNSGGFWAIQALVGISGFFVFLGSWVILSKLIQGISN